jgi:hypothetical protein
MAAKLIKELRGFSGAQVMLMKKREMLFIRKIGNIDRNEEQLKKLSDKFPVPKIYGRVDDRLDIEYLHGLDIKSYLLTHSHDNLADFIIGTLTEFSKNSKLKDYSDTYKENLSLYDFSEFSFTAQDLFKKLPKILPKSLYHGDFTLENIIYTEDRGFFMIDCSSGIWDSYVFDIAKLRQDLECGWFLRYNPISVDVKISAIQKKILEQFPEADNNYLLILMLLRVNRYTMPNTIERNLIIQGITRLWK